MFNNAISSTTLTSEIADRLFSNIVGSDMLDNSFLATLRSLLHKRLPRDKTFKMSCRKIDMQLHALTRSTVSRYLQNWFAPGSLQDISGADYNIVIVYATHPEVGQKLLEIIRALVGVGKRQLNNYNVQEDLEPV